MYTKCINMKIYWIMYTYIIIFFNETWMMLILIKKLIYVIFIIDYIV